MGNQGHATEGIRYVREWYDAGVLGAVAEVTAWFGGVNFDGRWFRKPDAFPPARMPVPEGLDWDLWLGPRPGDIPYNPVYHPRTWRGFFGFGSGLLGDWSLQGGGGSGESAAPAGGGRVFKPHRS